MCPYGTVTSLSESPLRFGLLYAGTDDGRAWMSHDGGYAWNEISKGLPAERWITRIEPSHFDEGTVYVTLSGLRNDESAVYLFKSMDLRRHLDGTSKEIFQGKNLNVIREDPANKNLLFVGSDFGVYASLDGGKHWQGFAHDMPNIPVHDLAIQAKAHDLVVGTHGRSAWVAPIEALEKFTAEVAAEPFTCSSRRKSRPGTLEEGPAHLVAPGRNQGTVLLVQRRQAWCRRTEPAE